MDVEDETHRADPSLAGKLRRRAVRLYRRRAARPVEARAYRPMVTFAFDDSPASAVAEGGRILGARGLKGTYFVCAGLAGQDGPLGRYASRDDIAAAARAGHEIACHTYSHLDCGQAEAVAVEADLARNADMLRAWGAADRLQTFAYPFGDVGWGAKRAAAARFALSRALHHGLIERGTDLNQAPAVGIEGDDGEALARRWLDKARVRRAWLVLFTHGVEAGPTPYGVSSDAFARLVDGAIAQGFEIVTAAEGARRMGAAAGRPAEGRVGALAGVPA